MPESKPLEEKIQKAIDKALYANGNPAAQKARNFLNAHGWANRFMLC